MNKVFFSIVLSTISVFFFIGCNNKKHVSISNAIAKDSMQKGGTLVSDTIFKQWLVDTIGQLNAAISEKEKKEGLNQKQFDILDDSLGLNINHTYGLDIEGYHKYSNTNFPQKLLSLLNEYSEYPETGSRLSFVVKYFFQPPSLITNKRDFIEKIEEIKVVKKDGNEVHEYKYIRGRLASKIIIIIDNKGKQQKKYFDFIWEGNKLVKRKL